MTTDEEAFDSLVMDIQSSGLNFVQEATGFNSVHCPICQRNDKRTGGFKFESDTIIYNCFRGSCDGSCVYTLGEPISRKFRNLMETLNVKIPMKLRMKKSKSQLLVEAAVESDLYEKNTYTPLKLPEDNLVILYDDDSEDGVWWKDYFLERSIQINGIRLVTDGDYKGCVLLPFYFDSMVIGWHYLTKKGVYIAHNGGNTNLIYTPTGRINQNLVILVEGTLDARSLPFCVGVLGDKITPQQAYHLRGKEVIMLPDRKGGNKFHEQFHDYGWKLCVPKWEVKDLNEAVIKYGKIVTAKMIKESLFEDKLKGQMAFKMWREQ